MSLSTENDVRETYRLSLEENLKKALKTQQEFDRYKAITVEAAQRIDTEKEAFQTHYQTRLTEAREVILREQETLRLEHPKPSWAVDASPSADKIDLLARNRVQADHEARIAAIRVDQVDQYKALKEDVRDRDLRQSHARDQRQNHAKEAFNLSNTISKHEARTRSGPSRS